MRDHLSPSAALGLALLNGLSVILGACSLAASPTGAPATPPPAAITAAPTSTPTVTLPAPTPEPTFLTYVVRRGDSLTSIAKRFRTTVDSIGYWNRRRYASLDPDSSSYAPDDLKVGWLLLVRPGQTTDGEDIEPTPAPTDDSPSPSFTPGPTASA